MLLLLLCSLAIHPDKVRVATGQVAGHDQKEGKVKVMVKWQRESQDVILESYVYNLQKNIVWPNFLGGLLCMTSKEF